MTKTELAQWLAKVSFRNGKNTAFGNDTLEKWEAHYMKMSLRELQEIYRSYGC